MTEKPFLKLTSKDFFTGISPAGAHAGVGGLFYKADGVTPVFEAGASQSTKNGLLMAGAAGTAISGALNGTVISSAKYTNASNTTAYFGTSTGHIFSLVLDTGFATSLIDAHTVSGLRQGLERFTSSSGSEMLFYFTSGNIGRFDLTATWNDTWGGGTSQDDITCSHRYFNRILFGNSGYVGQIKDDGTDMSTSAGNLTKNMMAIGTKGRVSDISDDGIYAVIACTQNLTIDTNAFSGSTILFWDGNSTQWQREYTIPDPFIYALEHTPLGVFAYGVTGIWQVSFSAEPKKVFPHSPGIYSTTVSSALQYGRPATSHYGDALMWGGASGSNKVVKTFGALDSSVPKAYLHPFISTASKNITMVDGQLLKGYVFVGDDTPLLTAYPFSGTPTTGVTAQTQYIQLPSKTNIKRIDLVFGEPLVTGDSVSVSVYKNQIDAAVSFGAATYTNTSTARRKQLIGSITCEDQMSLSLTYSAGAPKIKAIEFYADQETP